MLWNRSPIFCLLCVMIFGLALPLAAQEDETPASTDVSPGDGEAYLDMEGMAVTGNQELPQSLMVVPWQESGPGDLFADEFKSLVDQDPDTVDREEFLRQLDYHAVKSGTLNDDAR